MSVASLSFTRLMRAIFLSLTVFALAACGGADKPEDVVQTWYKAAVAGDTEAALKHLYLDEVPADQMAMAKGKVQMIIGEVARQAKANDGLKKIDVLDTNIDEAKQRATVRVRLTFGNGKDKTETVRLRQSDKKWRVVLG